MIFKEIKYHFGKFIKATIRKIFKDDEKLKVLEDEFHGRELIETFSLLVAAVLFIIYLIFGDIF